MKLKYTLSFLFLSCVLAACGGSSNNEDVLVDVVQDNPQDTPLTTLPDAFLEFDSDNVTSVIDGADVIIETNGLPNHTSPYWSATHPLYIDPIVTTKERLVPGTIDKFVGTYTLTVPGKPVLATSSSATSLGGIGIAVSGSLIYNDKEAANQPLDDAVGGLDYNGAHTGPSSYHYHLEPIAISDDDSNLIGIIADGFFLYGRKCNSTGTYPDDLDSSGGHTSITQHNTDETYHYHVQNELYLDTYYILFPGNYEGTPSAIN
jgi:hypothetical protein